MTNFIRKLFSHRKLHVSNTASWRLSSDLSSAQKVLYKNEDLTTTVMMGTNWPASRGDPFSDCSLDGEERRGMISAAVFARSQ